MSELPPGLPLETKAAYQRYLKLPLAGRAVLTKRVENYLETVGSESGQNEFLDVELAHRIGASLLKLIPECHDIHLPHIQAATLYFIENDDAAPDLGTVLGFEDDAKVLNAVCGLVGRLEQRVRL